MFKTKTLFCKSILALHLIMLKTGIKKKKKKETDANIRNMKIK